MASKRNTTHVYITVVEIEDWGPAVTKVIIDLGKKIPLNEVKKDTFKVHVTRSDERLSKPFLEEGNRKVSGAYVSDNKGNQLVCGTSNYVAIEMEIGPTIRLGSPMNYDGEGSGYNHWIQYEVTIYQVEDIVTHGEVIKDLIINRSVGEIRKLVDQFQIGSHNSDKKTLTYAEYIPKKGNQQKHPLFIWLHGAGEGGTDPTVAIGGTKVVNFNTEEIQVHLHNAYILVPQTHGFWMEGFIGFGDGTSIYQEALMSLIEEYMASHLDIDPNRIYIGGYSNGGYMTMLMLRDYPDFFAAGLPTCEALRDDLITKKDISNLAKTPIWFVHAKNDSTVDPIQTVLPIYKRLLAIGAHVHLSLYDRIVDKTGLYKDGEGNPYEYDGHFSWIHVYNNNPIITLNGDKLTIMEWLGNQSLSV